ncbi:D-2-hydroxyacid dehydrogenase [Priestia megaterium]|nr:D-2-hydroxyacid dehydrogenase [Priestia megaterium]
MHIDKILVTSRIYKDFERLMAQENIQKQFRYLDESMIRDEDLQWADAYVGFQPSPNFAFHQLKWVHSLGAGVDRFLEDGNWKDDVLLTRTICSFGQRISEYCLSYILNELQHHQIFQQAQQARQWKPVEPILLSTQNILVYGTGEIGQHIASVLKVFGATVNGVSRSGSPRPSFDNVAKILTEQSLVKEADWIISTLPLTKETYRLFDEKWMSMVEDVYFINVGRGATVNMSALVEALQKRRVLKAYLDVFEEEPVLPEVDLWENEHVVMTPHISAVTTSKEAVSCFIHTLQRIERRESLDNEVQIQRGY